MADASVGFRAVDAFMDVSKGAKPISEAVLPVLQGDGWMVAKLGGGPEIGAGVWATLAESASAVHGDIRGAARIVDGMGVLEGQVGAIVATGDAALAGRALGQTGIGRSGRSALTQLDAAVFSGPARVDANLTTITSQGGGVAEAGTSLSTTATMGPARLQGAVSADTTVARSTAGAKGHAEAGANIGEAAALKGTVDGRAAASLDELSAGAGATGVARLGRWQVTATASGEIVLRPREGSEAATLGRRILDRFHAGGSASAHVERLPKQV